MQVLDNATDFVWLRRKARGFALSSHPAERDIHHITCSKIAAAPYRFHPLYFFEDRDKARTWASQNGGPIPYRNCAACGGLRSRNW